jgi:RNA polymerase-binding transcription factor DksA
MIPEVPGWRGGTEGGTTMTTTRSSSVQEAGHRVLPPALVAELAARLEADARAIMARAALDLGPAPEPAARDDSEQQAIDLERDVHAILDARATAALEAIEAALERIEWGTFGRCEECGRSVGEARLIALPHAARCLECQASNEHRRV